jgi:hypothetical protein
VYYKLIITNFNIFVAECRDRANKKATKYINNRPLESDADESCKRRGKKSQIHNTALQSPPSQLLNFISARHHTEGKNFNLSNCLS